MALKYKLDMWEARDEGEKLGEERGIRIGEKQEKISIVKNMLSENMDINLISRLSGLSVPEIEDVQSSMDTD